MMFYSVVVDILFNNKMRGESEKVYDKKDTSYLQHTQINLYPAGTKSDQPFPPV